MYTVNQVWKDAQQDGSSTFVKAMGKAYKAEARRHATLAEITGAEAPDKTKED